MDDEKSSALYRRFPALKGIEHHGMAIGNGWHDLLEQLLLDIERLNPTGFKILQIKEKFGGLRFYFQVNPEFQDAVNEMVAQAERVAEATCEVCGEPGELRVDRPWLKTLCDTHSVIKRSA